MNKIFRYELRRLLWNKLFFGILLVSLGYGWLTLTGSVVRGVAHTAPFPHGALDTISAKLCR